MATLVHDDLIDGAARPARPRRRLERARRGRREGGRRLPLRARVRRARRDRRRARPSRCSPTRRSRSRAARRCSGGSATTPTRPSTSTSSAARSRPGSSSRPRACSAAAAASTGGSLGIAFQIADDILDCAGETIETGKVPGHRPPRRHADAAAAPRRAARTSVVRAALAGGPNEGVLVRVAATGALERSRELALDYASEARACLDGDARRDELEALTPSRRGPRSS